MALLLVGYVCSALALTWLSRKPLRIPGSHGFYRFFAWQGMLMLIVIKNGELGIPLFTMPPAVVSLLMYTSLALVVAGVWGLRKFGKLSPARNDAGLYGFERTTRLVTKGVFRYIRHPMYSSLLFLTWGLFARWPTVPGGVLALVVTVLLGLTARADERECQAYFGWSYRYYQKATWAFIPLIY